MTETIKQKENIDSKEKQTIDKQKIEDFEYTLEYKKAYNKYPNLKWSYLWEWFFSISTKWDWEIDIFYKDIHPYFNVIEVRKGMQKDWVYESIFKLAWYEEKVENKIHKMLDLKTWKELDPYSKEYFKAWQEIMFYEVYRFINHSSIEELKRSLYETLDFLHKWIQDVKSLRIKDNEKITIKLWLSLEQMIRLDIPKFKPETIKWWILDERFEKVQDIPTREEYEEYLNKWYISKDLYDESMILFDLRDEKKKQKEEILKNTQQEIYNN